MVHQVGADMRTFGDKFRLAGAAIEFVFEEALDPGSRWPDIKPYEDTGMNVGAWLETSELITSKLNELIDPDYVSVPENVRKDHGAKFLYEFQLYLTSIIPD